MKYTWAVNPVTYEDKYEVNLQADFETHVPMPVVTVEPNTFDLDTLLSLEGEMIQFNITNHGLIRANNLQFRGLIGHPLFKFSSQNNDMGNLEPLSSIIVPIKVDVLSRKKRYVGIVTAVRAAAYVMSLYYNFICGSRLVPIIIRGVSGSWGWIGVRGGVAAVDLTLQRPILSAIHVLGPYLEHLGVYQSQELVAFH